MCFRAAVGALVSQVARYCVLQAKLTGDTRKIFVDESHLARFLIGCKPIKAEGLWLK